MNRLVSLLLVLVLVFTASATVLAEEYTLDTSFDGVVFTYEDINMQIKIPSSWYRAELTDAAKEKGYFDCFASEDGTYLMLSIVDNTVENILSIVETNETIQDPAVIQINGIEALTYLDTEFESYGTVIPFADGSQSVMVLMGPAGDEAVAEQLMTLTATIDTIQ